MWIMVIDACCIFDKSNSSILQSFHRCSFWMLNAKIIEENKERWSFLYYFIHFVLYFKIINTNKLGVEYRYLVAGLFEELLYSY